MKTPARWVVLASVFLSLGSGSELAAFTVMATAQETAAETSVSGTVTDSTGGVLIGATVTLRGAGGAARTAVTDVRGRYRFERVARGAHTLHANQDGFKPTTVELNVETGPVTTDLTLSAASLAEEVTVSFTVDRSHAALKFDSAIRDIPLTAKSYTQSFIKALNVKDASEVYTYMNGINRSGHGAFDTVIRGIAAGATNTLQVDGMPGLATRSVGPNVANIDRIEILKGPAAILYGRTQPGGLVNFVTKRPQAEPQYLFELRSGTFFGTGPDLGDNSSYRLGTDFTGPIGKSKHVLYRLIFSYKDNPLEKISFDQLDAMFSKTRHRGGKPINRWGQLGLTGEWADKPVHLYGVEAENGFARYPRQKILSYEGQRGEWRDDITLDDFVFVIARRVAADRYGIGYCGLSQVDAGVRILALAESGTAPFYAPAYENVALARYPLSRLLYFTANKAPGKPLHPVLEELLRFVLSKEGQQVVLNRAVYLPLRSEQANDARAVVTGAHMKSRFFGPPS